MSSDPEQAQDQDQEQYQHDREQRHLAQETKNERMVWWYLAYFLFGIHVFAFIMIYAVTHADR
ncbi:hypothetical protein [Streptomyces apocyni]|uniref:hypothetical protein n=1 Tax=Streptomyces apocyni TaxID=2654677 RepID=UPI0012E9F764|nr:hypothetical protein [Streptomyces apocyni]